MSLMDWLQRIGLILIAAAVVCVFLTVAEGEKMKWVVAGAIGLLLFLGAAIGELFFRRRK